LDEKEEDAPLKSSPKSGDQKKKEEEEEDSKSEKKTKKVEEEEKVKKPRKSKKKKVADAEEDEEEKERKRVKEEKERKMSGKLTLEWFPSPTLEEAVNKCMTKAYIVMWSASKEARQRLRARLDRMDLVEENALYEGREPGKVVKVAVAEDCKKSALKDLKKKVCKGLVTRPPTKSTKGGTYEEKRNKTGILNVLIDGTMYEVPQMYVTAIHHKSKRSSDEEEEEEEDGDADEQREHFKNPRKKAKKDATKES
jgi:hypothetical protein